MTDINERILDDDNADVEGHAQTEKYSADVTASTPFRRIRGVVSTTDEDDEDVEGHGHVRHHRR